MPNCSFGTYDLYNSKNGEELILFFENLTSYRQIIILHRDYNQKKPHTFLYGNACGVNAVIRWEIYVLIFPHINNDIDCSSDMKRKP